MCSAPCITTSYANRNTDPYAHQNANPNAMLSLPAKLTLNDADAIARNLRSQISSQPGEVAIDASLLQEFDSSALAVLVACRREALAAGKQFAVSQLPDKLAQLASLYGIDPLLASSGSAR